MKVRKHNCVEGDDCVIVKVVMPRDVSITSLVKPKEEPTDEPPPIPSILKISKSKSLKKFRVCIGEY